MEIIKTWSLYLDSRQLTIGNSNNGTFVLNPAITLTNINNRFVVCAEMIELPYSFNQISNNYNTLDYTYTDVSGTYNATLIFPEGNYNINQLISTFIGLLLLDILLHRPSSTLTTKSFNIIYNSATSKVTFNITYPTTISITLKFTMNAVLGGCFGFPATNVTFGTATILTSTNKVDCNPVTAVYLRSESLKFATSYEAIVQPYVISDIICKVPVVTLPNSILYFKSDQKQMINNTELSTLNLYWSDNLSSTYSLDLKGLQYAVYITISEVMIKENNSFADKLGIAEIKPPKQLYEERDKLLLDLLKEKEKLEKEVEEARNAKVQTNPK